MSLDDAVLLLIGLLHAGGQAIETAIQPVYTSLLAVRQLAELLPAKRI